MRLLTFEQNGKGLVRMKHFLPPHLFKLPAD